MKLKIEMIPRTAYGQNLRSLLSDREWRAISLFVREGSGCVCEICSKQVENIGMMDAHEVWKYQKIKGKNGKKQYVQKLKKIVAICKECHAVKHLGHSKHSGDYQHMVEHFVMVNNCSPFCFKQAESKSYIRFNKRSKHKWKMQIGVFKIRNAKYIIENGQLVRFSF